MNREQLLERMKKLQEKEMQIAKAKNEGYSGEDDALENFKFTGEVGFIARMGDKLMRAKNLLKKGESDSRDESIKDTLMDLANYANLLIIYLEEKGGQ